ncbi:Small subunit (SSU) processome component [Didymosphaeria variabile]|uniref:Small subunit (SSU) processome component n=1 Tax=Didymosphaeria variabile TaxID=1932322 RepID=A0A9W8XPL0_9PLEO|nr:Small subunit (SSU) processome component [Didymosphaeria variabile]KAJ4355987.1 Small subunit (SSU) processome component [Didymosphaeria variabile]
MPAPLSSRARAPASTPKAARDAHPPTKKAKLSQPAGLKSLINGTPNKKPAVSAKTNGVRNDRKGRVDEATAVVSGGYAGHGDVDMDAVPEIIQISSAEEDSDDSNSEDEDSDAGSKDVVPAANGQNGLDRPIEDGTAEPEELSFGERLKAQEPEAEPVREPRVVHVESAFVGADADARELATASIRRPLAAPSATSLSTVLTQALRTNDQELLDSCLRVNDVDTIYSTIERLPSPLVGALLQKLAERLHKRPGRPGMLMVWVQWSLATHGGYLATQSNLIKQTATLTKVLTQRSTGLQPLLSLKGRLDMLQTQLELRRRNQERAAKDDMDEAVIYVEGEEEPSSDEDEADDSDVVMEDSRKRSQRDVDDEVESSVDGMPTTMEVDELSEEGSEDSEDLIDDEAEETDDDSGEDLSGPDEELDGEEVSESEEEAKPERRSTAARAGLSRRR